MGDIIVNGYIIMWQLALLLSWTPIGFLVLELNSGFKRATGKKRKILKVAMIANIVIVVICIATLPIQLALMNELWRG